LKECFILENMRDYFLNGTFDSFDLLASSVGAVAAYWVLVRTREEEEGFKMIQVTLRFARYLAIIGCCHWVLSLLWLQEVEAVEAMTLWLFPLWIPDRYCRFRR